MKNKKFTITYDWHVLLTQTPPQTIVIEHKQLTKQIPVSNRIPTINRAKEYLEYLDSLFQRTKHRFN